MKQRYSENFLFPQGAEDFGRSLVFPQGQLHGLGAAVDDAAFRAQAIAWGFDPDVPEQRNIVLVEIAKRAAQKAADDAYDAYIAARTAAAPAAQAQLVFDATGRATDASVQAANAYQAQQAAAQEAAMIAAEANIQVATQAAQAQIVAEQQAAAQAAAAAAATAAVTTNPAILNKTITTVATTTTPPPATNVTYVLDFYSNQFWLKRSDGVAIANGSPDWRSAALLIAPYNIALANVTITPAAAAKFASNNATVTAGTTATSTGVTATSAGTQTGVATTTTTNQTTGTTTVTNTATGVTATTNPVTGTTTVSKGSDTGKLALYALLGVLLLRGAVR